MAGSEGSDGGGDGYMAPGAEGGAGFYEAGAMSRVARTGLVVFTTCVSPGGAPTVVDGGPRDAGSAVTRPVKAHRPQRFGAIAEAATPPAVQEERARVVFVLEEPAGFDGSVFVHPPSEGAPAPIDTRAGRTIGSESVRPFADEVRRAVAVVLNLPCRADGFFDVDVELGCTGSPRATWNLKVQTPDPMQTFGGQDSIPASTVGHELTMASAPTLQPGEQSPVNFGPQQWLTDGLKHTAGGKVVNNSDSPRRLNVTVEGGQPYVLVADGREYVPQGFVADPGQTVQVIVYSNDALYPPEPAVIQVDWEEI